jgi:hypothetical protein
LDRTAAGKVRATPPDKRQQFNGAMRRLAVIFSELAKRDITPEAVEQQVDWAITVQKEIRNQGHARQFILNKAAALEVGFIVASDLPGYMNVSKDARLSKSGKNLVEEALTMLKEKSSDRKI